jgi:uncharacterized protein (UPF0335 family)
MARRPGGQARKPRSAAGKKPTPTKAINPSDLRNSRDPKLQKLTERLMNLSKERLALSADIADVYASAKDQGYDVPPLRKVIKILIEDAEQRSKRIRVEEATDELLVQLGHLADTELGEAALRAAEGKAPPPRSDNSAGDEHAFQ